MLEWTFGVDVPLSLTTRHANTVRAVVFQKVRDQEAILEPTVPLVQRLTARRHRHRRLIAVDGVARHFERVQLLTLRRVQALLVGLDVVEVDWLTLHHGSVPVVGILGMPRRIEQARRVGARRVEVHTQRLDGETGDLVFPDVEGRFVGLSQIDDLDRNRQRENQTKLFQRRRVQLDHDAFRHLFLGRLDRDLGDVGFLVAILVVLA